MLKLLSIDDFVDTLTYHLYNQMHPFIDKVNFDFLPSSSFFFPLGDRLNYIFVNFLGIRFGTILSCYVAIILYYQFKNILKILVPDLKVKMRTFYVLLILFSVSVAIYIGSFFTDNFSSILLFELVYIFVQNINLLKNKKYLYLSTFIMGALVGIKLTNLFLGVPIITLLLIRNIKENGFKELKNIRIYDYFLLVVTAISPFIIYLLNNYIQTGNPVFPFVNNIFNSVYYKNVTGADTRFGAKNFFEFIIWPIYICFDSIRGNDIYSIIENTWGLGYIFTICSLCNYKKQKSDINWFSLLLVVLTFIWIKFVSGYVRYGLVLSYCFYIIIIYYLEKEFLKLKDLFAKRHEKPLCFLIFELEILVMIVLFALYISTTISYSLYYYRVVKSSNIKPTHDIETKISAPYDIDGVWMCTRYNNYYTDIIRDKEDPMFNLDVITPIDPMCRVKSGYSEYTQELFKEKIKNKSLYMAIPFNYDNYIFDLLKINNMEIVKTIGYYENSEYLNPYNYILIVQVDFK